MLGNDDPAEAMIEGGDEVTRMEVRGAFAYIRTLADFTVLEASKTFSLGLCPERCHRLDEYLLDDSSICFHLTQNLLLFTTLLDAEILSGIDHGIDHLPLDTFQSRSPRLQPGF